MSTSSPASSSSSSFRRVVAVVLEGWRASLLAEAEYRSNFVFAAISSLLTLAGSIFSIWLFYRAGAGFPGWNLADVTVVLGLFSICTGYVATLLSPNLSRIVTHVTEGTLEFVLLKPIDSQLQVSLRLLSPWGVPDIVFGVILVVVGLVQADKLAPAALLGLVPMLSAAVLLYALWFTLASTSIWFTKIYNATEVLRGLLDAGRYPMAAYPAAYRFVFTFVVPVAFVTTVPAEVLLQRTSSLSAIGGSVVVAVLALVVSRLVWKAALRSYTGAST